MLLNTLHSDFNVDSNLLRLLNSYFTKRHFSIQLSDYTAPACNFKSACPQGLVLAALLFSVFINDLSAKLSFDHIVFADDLIFFTDNTSISLVRDTLSNGLEKVHEWCDSKQLFINFSKTKYMIFGQKSDLCLKDKTHSETK